MKITKILILALILGACAKEDAVLVKRPGIQFQSSTFGAFKYEGTSLNEMDLIKDKYKLVFQDSSKVDEFRDAILYATCGNSAKISKVSLGTEYRAYELFPNQLWLQQADEVQELECKLRLSVSYKSFSEDDHYYTMKLTMDFNNKASMFESGISPKRHIASTSKNLISVFEGMIFRPERETAAICLNKTIQFKSKKFQSALGLYNEMAYNLEKLLPESDRLRCRFISYNSLGEADFSPVIDFVNQPVFDISFKVEPVSVTNPVFVLRLKSVSKGKQRIYIDAQKLRASAHRFFGSKQWTIAKFDSELLHLELPSLRRRLNQKYIIDFSKGEVVELYLRIGFDFSVVQSSDFLQFNFYLDDVFYFSPNFQNNIEPVKYVWPNQYYHSRIYF